MAENSKIEWTDHTFNPWIGCQAVSPDGCKNCYAEALVQRFGDDFSQRRRTSEANWKLPLKWNARAAREGRRFRVFCASLADVFDNQVPVQWRRDLFDLIEATPHLDWLLLTKRIGNARSLYAEAYLDSARQWPANVWLGATVVNQGEADRDIPKLLAVPARVRFLSMEPLMGPVDLEQACDIAELEHCAGTWDTMADPQRCHLAFRHGSVRLLDWVIVGGESGHGARPMHPQWARDLRDQCEAAGVPFLFKQWGEWTPGVNVVRMHGKVQTAELHEDGWHLYREDLARDGGHIDDEPDLYRVGKKEAGRVLDGRVHDGFPG